MGVALIRQVAVALVLAKVVARASNKVVQVRRVAKEKMAVLEKLIVQALAVAKDQVDVPVKRIVLVKSNT